MRTGSVRYLWTESRALHLRGCRAHDGPWLLQPHPVTTHALTRRGAITLAAAATTAALAGPAYADDGRHGHHDLPDTVALPDGLQPEGITSGPGDDLLRRLGLRRPDRHRRPPGVGTTRAAARRRRALAARALPRPAHRAGLGGRQPRRRRARLGRRRHQRRRRGRRADPRRRVPQRPRDHRACGVGHRLRGRPADPDRPEPSRPPARHAPRPSCPLAARGRPRPRGPSAPTASGSCPTTRS